MKGVMCFGKKGKLSPHYIGPYEILECVGVVVYRLALPQELARVHLVFHVSMLHKYLPDPSHMLPPQALQLEENLCYEEKLIDIVDKQVKKLCSKEISTIKVA